MTTSAEIPLDDIDWQLIRLLQEDARLSMRELSKRVNLSAPAVAERVHKLTDAGVICGYHAEIDRAKIGLSLTAFTQLSVPRANSNDVAIKLESFPEILECHRVSGEFSFILKVSVASVAQLESFIDRIAKLGNSTTSIVLSTRINKKITDPPVDSP
jgi:Lrp/AsnC family leucine-responsive transcriptional regulator